MKTNDLQNLSAKLFKVADPKNDFPDYRGILLEEGKAVATNGHILVAIKCDYPENLEGKVVDKNLEIADYRFPKWKTIIPDEFGKKLDIDTNKLYKACKNIKSLRFKNKKKAKNALVVIDKCCYNANYVFNILNIEKNVDMFYRRNVLYFMNKEMLALQMRMSFEEAEFYPLNEEYKEDTGYNLIYTIEEALNFKK